MSKGFIFVDTSLSMEDVEVDQDLSFLDEFVQNAIARGAKSYIRPSERTAPISSRSPFKYQLQVI